MYYYGARYLDPKYSRWLSGDPAIGEYIPQAGADTSKLPNNGVYNSFNFAVFGYANNNPVKYNDPTGRNPVYDIEGELIGVTENSGLQGEAFIMNKEDYEIAVKNRLCNHDIFNINGMGIPKPPTFSQEIRSSIRSFYSIADDEILFTYVGELSKRKNQIFLINNITEISKVFPKFRLILAGNGDLYNFYKSEIGRLRLLDKVILAGHVNNVKQLIYSSDIIISSSISEGLPFNIMEAMSIGIPVVASKIKGHIDLIIDGHNGYLFDLNSDSFAYKLRILKENTDIQNIKCNEKNDIQKFMIDSVFDDNIKLMDM